MKTNEIEWNSGFPGDGTAENTYGSENYSARGPGQGRNNEEGSEGTEEDDDFADDEGLGNDYADDPDADDLNDDSDATV